MDPRVPTEVKGAMKDLILHLEAAAADLLEKIDLLPPEISNAMEDNGKPYSGPDEFLRDFLGQP
jgi:hypothetical protein